MSGDATDRALRGLLGNRVWNAVIIILVVGGATLFINGKLSAAVDSAVDRQATQDARTYATRADLDGVGKVLERVSTQIQAQSDTMRELQKDVREIRARVR